jgi:hypothetical protein
MTRVLGFAACAVLLALAQGVGADTDHARERGDAALVAAAPASADEPAVAAGTRVRVTTAEKRLVGRVVTVRDDILVLQRGAEEDPLEIRRPDVLAIEVSERTSRRGKGAKIGALAGLGGAIALGVVAGESCSPPPGHVGWGNLTEALDANMCFSHAETAFMGGILLVPLGALVGLAVAPGEKWRPAGASGLSVQAGPSRGGGVGLRLAVRF